MRTKIVWIIVFLIFLFSVALNLITNKDVEVVKPVDINVGDEFTSISYPKTMYVLNYVIGDITGDNVNDMVIVVGNKNSVDDKIATDIDVVVYDSSSSNYYKAGLKKYSGELASINLADFVISAKYDVLVSVKDESNYYNVRIVSFDNGEFKEIFRQKNNLGVTFSGNFLDGFKASVKCRKLNIENVLDLSNRKDNYILTGLYDDSGKLLKSDVKIYTGAFTNVEIVQLTGSKGLKTTQRIVGVDGLDIIDEIVVIWKLEDGKWQMKEAIGNKQGNLLY